MRTILCFLMCCFGAGMMWAWDRHGPIFLSLPIPWVHPTLSLPPSLAMQRDAAQVAVKTVTVSLDVCHSSNAAIRSGQTAANAALEADAAQGARRAQMLVDGLKASRKTVSVATSRANALEALTIGDSDECAAFKQVDQVVLEGRK